MRLFKVDDLKPEKRGYRNMEIKLIKSNKLDFINDGAYGDYSKIKNTNNGVKVMRPYFDDNATSFTDAINSHNFRLVKKEFKRLKKLNKMTRCVPKARHLAIVEHFNEELNITVYLCGYVMSHIKGKLAHNLSLKDLKKLDAARARLEKKGIYQIDSHGGNVIVKTIKNKKRFTFIDAGGLRFNEYDSTGWS